MRATRVVLRLFTDIREGEEASALMLLANVFLILCAYYFIKPLREGWISVSEVAGLSKTGVKASTAFAQVLLLIPIVTAYGRFSARWQRSVLITRMTLFCMSNMVIFWALQPGFFIDNLPIMGVVFYLWVGIFGVFVVAQFWSFAADIYSQGRGKRLLPLVAIGATAGAAFGSGLAGWLVQSRWVGTEWLLIVALIPLGLSIVLTRVVDRRESEANPLKLPSNLPSNAPSSAAGTQTEPKEDGPSALSIVFSTRFLIAVAGITLLLNWVNTNGENLLFRVVQDFLSQEAVAMNISDPEQLLVFTRDGTTVFYSSFYGLVNLLALGLQAFAASRILKYGGFGLLLLILPVVAMFSYAAMAIVPILAVVKLMKVAENATDYSLNNTARNVLWLPVASSVIYKAKPAIDTLFARLGDGFAALTVIIGMELMALPIGSFFVFNLALVIIWLLASIIVVREHRVLEESADDDTS